MIHTTIIPNDICTVPILLSHPPHPPHRRQKQRFTKKAEEIKTISINSAVETVDKLQTKLGEFATKYQYEIQNDPVFRQRFLQMCGPLNVDPLVSNSPKNFWSKALGVGMNDFYYELAVKIVEICYATKTKNGGIITVKEVYDILNTRNKKANKRGGSGKSKYSINDIPIAIKKLSILGGGFRIVKIGNNSDMIVSVPTELDQDHMEIMGLATSSGGDANNTNNTGCITKDDVMNKLKWNAERTERALTLLLQEGMVWEDNYHGIIFYWFPSIWKEENNQSNSNPGNDGSFF